MRHTFCLFLGEEFRPLAESMQHYMESVDAGTSKFCHVALLDADAIRPLVGADTFENDAAGLSNWIDTLFNVETSQDDSLTLCAVLPLWHAAAVDVAASLVAHTQKLHSRHRLDFVGLLPDLAKASGFEQPLSDGPTDLKPWRCEGVHRFIVLSEKNRKGQALRFNQANLAHVLGDYFAVCIEAYDDFYPASEESDKVDITAIGLSEFYLDRNYFAEYLIHHSYLSVMEREKIHESGVDSNKAARLSREGLGNVNIVGKFFANHVEPLLEKSPDIDNEHDEQIVTDLTPTIDRECQALKDRLLGCLADDQLSLPEKECVLALELGEDDKLLVNTQYNETQFSIDDYFTEPIEWLLAENNRLPGEVRDDEGNVVQQSQRVINNFIDASRPVENPLPEVKQVHKEIMDIEAYLRRKDREKEGLKRVAESEATSRLRLVDDGATLSVENGKDEDVADFAKDNAAIQNAAIRHSEAQQEQELKEKKSEYDGLRWQYEDIKQKLQQPDKYKAIKEKSQAEQQKQIAKLEEQITSTETEQRAYIDAERRQRWKRRMKIVLFAVAVALTWGVCWYFIDEWLLSTGSRILAAAFLVSLLVFSYVSFYDKKAIRQLEEQLNQTLSEMRTEKSRRRKDMRRMSVRLHIAQMFIERFERVRNEVAGKYHAVKGYVGNLKTWYDEEAQTITHFVQPPTSGIFKPILRNDVLDRYFDENVDELIEDVRLANYIEQFDAETGTGTLRDMKQQIRSTIEGKLFDRLNDFSVCRYITGTAYPYLPEQGDMCGRLIPDMERSSQTFLHTKEDATDRDALYVALYTANQDEAALWNREYKQYFQQPPTAFATSSPYKLLVLRRLYTKEEAIVE